MSRIGTTEFKDLKEALDKTEELNGDSPAYIFKTNEEGIFKEISHREVRQMVKALGTELIDMGLKDKRIAVISENRYEWEIAYLAIATGTGIVVPLDKLLQEKELENLIIRADVEAIFYSEKYDEVMKSIREAGNTNIKFYISMDLEENTNEIYSQKSLINSGNKLLENGDRRFLDAKIDENEMQFILFTSGTTANSKAVMLSHKNIVADLKGIEEIFNLDSDNTMLSFLPLHHTFECTTGFLYPIIGGLRIAFSDGVRHLSENIKEYKVSAMISVPILYEGIYKAIIKGIKKKGQYEKFEKGIKLSNTLRKFGLDFRKKIFKEIHENLGGRIKVFVAGGAALDPQVSKGFDDIGIPLLQGYGLTETSPVIVAEGYSTKRIGSVGKAMPGDEIKIIEPNEQGIGEIAVKGDNIMLGYYQDEENTNKVLKGGWFYTGDLGYMDKDGFIFISGRKKDVIVLQNGKNVYPEEIETLINKVEGIKDSFVYGRPEDDGDVRVCAKIVYDKDTMKTKYNLEDEEQIKEFIWNQIKTINKTMPVYKYVRDLIITEEELIKTTTQKIKRHEELKKVLEKK